MTFVLVTTDANHIYLPMGFFVTDYNDSLPLRINSTSSFTLSYALWPFIGLISLIATVWLLVHISIILSRRHSSKNGHRNSASFYVTRDETIVPGYEYSTVISPFDV